MPMRVPRPRRPGAVLPALVLALLGAISPAPAVDGGRRPSAPGPVESFWTRFKENLAFGVTGRSMGTVAFQAAQTLTDRFAPFLVTHASAVLPGATGRQAVRLVTEAFNVAAVKIGWDLATSEFRHRTQGVGRTPIDLREVAAVSVAVVTLSGLMGRVIPGPLGVWIGSWVGWNLAVGMVAQHRSGKRIDPVAALRGIDLARLSTQMLATEGAALGAARLVASFLGGTAVAGGAIAVVATLLAQVALASVANAAATALYDTLREGPIEGRAPPVPDTGRVVAADVASLGTRVEAAYSRYVALTRSGHGRVREAGRAFIEYATLRADLERVRRGRHAGSGAPRSP